MRSDAVRMYVYIQLETLAVADFDVARVQRVPLWIIIVAVIAGLILLTIVIVLLWKVTNSFI